MLGTKNRVARRADVVAQLLNNGELGQELLYFMRICPRPLSQKIGIFLFHLPGLSDHFWHTSSN